MKINREGTPIERIGTALQKVVEGIEVGKGPTLNDAEIDCETSYGVYHGDFTRGSTISLVTRAVECSKLVFLI